MASSTRLYTNFLENQKEKGKRKTDLKGIQFHEDISENILFIYKFLILQNSLIVKQCTQGTIGSQDCLPHTRGVEANPDGTRMCHGNTGPDFRTQNSL